jgi:hypothetical protein
MVELLCAAALFRSGRHHGRTRGFTPHRGQLFLPAAADPRRRWWERLGVPVPWPWSGERRGSVREITRWAFGPRRRSPEQDDTERRGARGEAAAEALTVSRVHDLGS